MTRIGRQEIYACLHNNRDRSKRLLSGVGASAVFACVGGILDAFTYFGHGRVFANSMTGNVVLLGVNVMQADWHQALRHLFPICSFFVGISAARIFYVDAVFGKIRNPDLAVLTLEIGLFGAIGCLPDASSDFLITTPIAFAASLQSEAFRRVAGFPFNSTFTTGNLRTLSESVFDFLFDNSQLAARRMVRTFSVICSMFLLGATTGAFLTQRLHNKTLWIVSLVLAFLWVRLIQRIPAVDRSSVETTCRHPSKGRRRIDTTAKEHPLWQR
jgi:uncharacterized membrane protein YoaK (UPF0700 family)